MKKIIAVLLCACCVAVLSAGCGYSDALDSASSSTESSTSAATSDETESEVKASDYENNLEGLEKYFIARGYITEDSANPDASSNPRTEMDASLIGAEEGYKYTMSTSLSVELYEFEDTANNTASEIINSVKTNGTFTILGLSSVEAYLSDSGKYLMIYTDSSIGDDDTSSDNYKTRANAISDFNAFGK